MTDTNWRRTDLRINSLKIIALSLENSILQLKRRYKKFECYDVYWLLEESEPIYGLIFISIQNYINSSIFDRFESLDKQYLRYKIGNQIKETGRIRTDIELIISVANYYKHRDHPNNLTGETSKILSDLNLQFDKDIEITNSPIFKGLEMISENWEIGELIKSTEAWREKLWTIKE